MILFPRNVMFENYNLKSISMFWLPVVLQYQYPNQALVQGLPQGLPYGLPHGLHQVLPHGFHQGLPHPKYYY